MDLFGNGSLDFNIVCARMSWILRPTTSLSTCAEGQQQPKKVEITWRPKGTRSKVVSSILSFRCFHKASSSSRLLRSVCVCVGVCHERGFLG